MKSFLKGVEARCARVAARRRAVAFAPQILDRLEARQLLAAGNLGINVEISPYTSLVNWLQVPGNWTANPGQSNTVTLNSSGDPNSDATLLFDDRVNQSFNGPDPNAVGPNLSGTYHLSFNGQATIEQEYPYFSTPFTVQNQAYNATTNTTTADLVVPSNNSADFFGITFANTQATATSSVDTGFSNARLIRPGYSANSTQLYTNEFLAALTPYSTLRYLDPENTNGQPYFNGNTLVTVNASQVDQTGLPWEYLVTLANQTNTDMWINIPQGATDDYVAAVAGIIKNGGTVNGVTYAGLNPNLKIYVEYSNEVWGGIPGNENYQAAAVQNSASNQPLSTFPGNQDIYQNSDGTTTTDVYTALGRRYLERTAEIGQIFQSVIGADPTHQHIRPVLGWQENNSAFYPAALSWFETYFGSASAAFYGMGNADYWGPTDYSSVNAVISSLQAQETSYAIPNAIDFTTIATYYGLKNVSYEGGPSISGDPSTAAGQVALAASRDPRMEALVYQHYIDYFEDGGALANYFDGPFGILTPSNEWPIAELNQYGDPSSSARYEGTVDLANAAPVAVTAGILVAPSSPTTFTASTDTLGTSLSNPTSGEQGFWLLNATSTETYDLALSTTAVVGKTPGQFEVFLNDKPVGGLFVQGSQSTIDLGNLSLTAGINTLSILIVTPGSQFQPSNFTLTPSQSLPTIADSGFEAETVGYGNYVYNPVSPSWTFIGSAGITGNNSGFTSGNPSTPQGSQVAFLQNQGEISQVVPAWTAGSYVVTFSAAERDNNGMCSEDFELLVDGVVVGSFKPTGATYLTYTSPTFTVTAGSHTIAFLGLDTVGGDNSAFLDNISVTAPPPPVPPPVNGIPVVSDSGFEAETVGSGNYVYNPVSPSWTFIGSSGITGNNSGFTSGNPSAPQGSQVAFLQDQGEISQVVNNWAAGSYTISFSAAERDNNGMSNEDFEILVDGILMGTFKPTGASYLTYSTLAFAVGAGSHTITFVGLDTVGGDNSAFLDNIAIS
jgi:hypothetical protein